MRRLARFLCLALIIGCSALAAAQEPPTQNTESLTIPPHFVPPHLVGPGAPEVINAARSVQTQIKEIVTGWDADIFGIITVAPLQTFCPKADDYAAELGQRGYQTLLSAALLAFAERATVVVTTQGCTTFGEPKLIGIAILR